MFDKKNTYIFSKKKYYEYILSKGRKISSVEKNFGEKYDKQKVKIINENSGVVDNQYQVMESWCEKIKYKY